MRISSRATKSILETELELVFDDPDGPVIFSQFRHGKPCMLSRVRKFLFDLLAADVLR